MTEQSGSDSAGKASKTPEEIRRRYAEIQEEIALMDALCQEMGYRNRQEFRTEFPKLMMGVFRAVQFPEEVLQKLSPAERQRHSEMRKQYPLMSAAELDEWNRQLTERSAARTENQSRKPR